MSDTPQNAADAAQPFDLVSQLPPDLAGEFFAHCDQLGAQHEAIWRHAQVEQELENSIEVVLKGKGLEVFSLKIKIIPTGESVIMGSIKQDDQKLIMRLFPNAKITSSDVDGYREFTITLERPTRSTQFEADVANLSAELDRKKARQFRDTRIMQHVRNVVASLGLGVDECHRHKEHEDPYSLYISTSTNGYSGRVYQLLNDIEDIQIEDLHLKKEESREAIAQKEAEIAEIHKGILDRLQELLGEGVECSDWRGAYSIKVPLNRKK
jgi:hypothetical protein